MTTARFRAGMVGAGNISEFHIYAVKALPGLVDLVGVADLDKARAEATAQKFGTTAYASLDALVAAGANVIHVLTPPAAHVPVALAALERGCHVLVEKPIAEDEAEGRKVSELAKKKGLTVSVNHSLLYDPQVKRALDAVRAGALGQVVSVDILRGSEYPPYVGGPLPPWYRGAGYPFRDLGIHCLYLVQELLGAVEHIDGEWSSLGGDPNLAYDEWRALVRCKRGIGQFQLTWNVKPMQSQMIIHGTRGVLRVDLFAMFHGKRSSTPLPKAAERLLNAVSPRLAPAVESTSPSASGSSCARRCRPTRASAIWSPTSIAASTPERRRRSAPTTRSRSSRSSSKIAPRGAEADHAAADLAKFKRSDRRIPFVVTGASGSLGSAIVLGASSRTGRSCACSCAAFPRESLIEGSSSTSCFGNLGDPVTRSIRAIAGGEVVIHAGAAMKGGWLEHLGGTVIGTQNVIDACKKHKVRQLVHISSMSVVDWAGSAGKGAVAENAALEPRAEERGAYTRAKLEAERKVSAAAKEGLPCVILRPGQIFGGGIPLVNGAVARRAGGRWLVLGDGKIELPLVYIEDVVDAVMASIERRITNGEIIQLIDAEHLTQSDVLALAGGGAKVFMVPRPVIFALGKLSELPLGAIGRPSPVALYRLQSALAPLHYESNRASSVLGWKPRVGVREGIRRAMLS